MRGFRFRLEKVLTVKKRREEQLQQELARLEQLYQEEEEMLRDLETQLAAREKAFTEQSRANGSLDPYEVQQTLAFLTYLQEESLRRQQRLRELLAQVTAERKRLLAAVQEREVLEELRRREYEEFRQAFLRAEQQFLDEVAMVGFVQKEAGLG